MGLFRRKPDPQLPGGARAFWEWWTAEGAQQVAAAHSDGRLDDVVAALTPRVRAVHPDLVWEIAAGRTAALLLVLTADGDPHRRRFARRWLRRAPAADETWEYADLRPAVDDVMTSSLHIGGAELAAADTQVGWVRRRNHLDVVVHHPAFPELSDEQRSRAAARLLDQALGEYDATLWLGRIQPSVAPVGSADRGSLLDLRGAVTALSDELTDSDGGPTWVLMSGETPQGKVTAVARVPLDPIVAPHLDDHLALSVGIADIDHTGFPSETGLQQLGVLEDAILANLGEAGLLVAHETTRGKRTFHFYIDSTTTAADYIDKVASGWRQGKVSKKVVTDPPWASVSHMRT